MSNAAHALSQHEQIKVDVSHLTTEDDAPVDNFPSEKQQRLLTEPLYSSWSGPPPLPDAEDDSLRRTFVAAANVGVFAWVKEQPLVPDAFLSLNVELAEDLWKKENRTYFVWEMGKPPDVVIEIVSNREGGELTTKLPKYARMGVPYYVVWDPQGIYGEPTLRAFSRHGIFFATMKAPRFAEIGLSLVLWEGTYEDVSGVWLRWADLDGNLIPTGAEKAQLEAKRADDEHKRANAAQARADRLAEKLRALGIDPNGDG